jgi:hypothetical protein
MTESGAFDRAARAMANHKLQCGSGRGRIISQLQSRFVGSGQMLMPSLWKPSALESGKPRDNDG